MSVAPDHTHPEGEKMLGWAKELFPLCRSLTGAGTLRTLEYFKNIHPELNILTFKTGEKVFDWEVPREWNIINAYIEHESGHRFAQFSESNLHVLNYATPIDTTMSLEALKSHIFTEPSQPDWVPYVSSYYAENWGFCMAQNQKDQLPDGQYKVHIDSSLKEGTLNVGEIVIPGESAEEIIFSSYVCHPSLANNELSGPVLAAALADYIKAQYPERAFTYRILFLVETIGAISYLSRRLDVLKDNAVAGFILSCVGDERSYSHIESRFGDSMADTALSVALTGHEEAKRFSYLERGSDERQFCAPGIDLPFCGFCRSRYGDYPEYHTSADNFDVVTDKGLQGSFDVMRNIIDGFETALYPQYTVLGEPQLGKRGLYINNNISQKTHNTSLPLRLDVLAYADGKTSVFDIAQIINKPLRDVIDEIAELKSHDLLKNGTP